MNQDGSGYGVYARRYTNAGVPAGGEFRVNQTTANWQHEPSIGMDKDGNFTITWTTFGQDTSGNAIYARSFRADGADVVLPNTSTPVGEYQVNTEVFGDQVQSAISVDPNGHFVAPGPGPTVGTGIFAQQFRVGPGSVALIIGGPRPCRPLACLPGTSTFFLRDSNSSGIPTACSIFGPANSLDSADGRLEW